MIMLNHLGGGRKVKDPKMEKLLYEWYKQTHLDKGIPVSSKDIKAKAKSFSSVDDFAASKGWLEKYKNKFQLELVRAKRTVRKQKN